MQIYVKIYVLVGVYLYKRRRLMIKLDAVSEVLLVGHTGRRAVERRITGCRLRAVCINLEVEDVAFNVLRGLRSKRDPGRHAALWHAVNVAINPGFARTWPSSARKGLVDNNNVLLDGEASIHRPKASHDSTAVDDSGISPSGNRLDVVGIRIGFVDFRGIVPRLPGAVVIDREPGGHEAVLTTENVGILPAAEVADWEIPFGV